MEKVVQVIPARKAGAGDGEQGATGEREKRKLRVAAYCRVSTEQGAERAIGDACTGSNPRQPSQEEMEKLLKACYYDTEVDF